MKRLAVMLLGWIVAIAADRVSTAAAQSDTRSSSTDRSAAPVRVATAAPTDEANAVRRVALVVGNAGYRSIAPLRNAANDAADVCAALRRLGFEAQCHQDIPTRSEFRRHLRHFAAQLGPQTAALVYYAGHGVQIDGRNLLLPTAVAAASTADLEAEALPLGEIFAAMRERRSALNIVVLDACRNDPFAANRGIRVARGLAREEPPPSSVLVFSTAPGGVAADGSGRNGLFTQHLLAQLERPGPQIGEMLQAVARSVEAEASRSYGIDQVPYRSFSFSGVFCFTTCDDQQLARQLDDLKRQRADAARRIQELEARHDASNSESARRESTERQREIETLRSEMKQLAEKAAQLEAYRQRIAVLERENREKEQQLAEGAKREERRSRPVVVPTF